LEARFGPLLDLAQRVRTQDQHQRGPKVYALHAPEVECIGLRQIECWRLISTKS
jgi:IS5 family transposase